jgi:TolB-like protein
LLLVNFIFILLLIMGCAAGANVTSGPDELDVAIREASDYLNENIPEGSMIVILNVQSDYASLSDYIIDGLITNAVNDRIFKVVDRQQLDLIRSEQNFQLSGEVDDNLAQSIGKFFGAQTIVSGRVSQLGDRYRMLIRALEVETAQVQGQNIWNIYTSRTMAALIRSGGGTQPASTRTTRSGSSQVSQPATQIPVQPTTITVEGASLTEKLQWLEENAVNNTEYRVEVTGNESLGAPTLSYPRRRNVTIRLISSEGERVLSLTGSGSLFTIESDVTLILDNGITLQGRNQNNASLIRVNSRGTLIMNEGGKIIGNTSSSNGGGVFVNENGNFTMTGGEISSNTSSSTDGGGGVYVNRNGNFTMSGGIIYGNNTGNRRGGGVAVDGSFTMTGGEIAGNTAGEWGLSGCAGGGVVVGERATFTMRGGEIYGNTATNYNGGGVAMIRGTFTMTGGVISGNTVSNGIGGGVYLFEGTFTKTGGIIYGSDGTTDDNRARNGHAVASQFPDRIRNSTAGPNVRLDPSRAGAAGGWEN